MEQTAALAVSDQPAFLSPAMQINQIKQQRSMVMDVMKSLMKDGLHYGKIPGTNNVALMKPGAEMLGMTFGLRATFVTHPRELANGHREYTVDCTLTYRDGSVLASASGLCTTQESKYRYRYAQRRCPGCQAEAIKNSKHNPGFYCWDKLGGCGQTFKGDDRRILGQKLGKVENPDIADQFNTVMKMAAKRAHVACIRLALAVSDMFEVEEESVDADSHGGHDEPAPPKRQAARQSKPAAEPTLEQAIAHECAQLATKLNRDKESLAELLKEGGGWAPKNQWLDLTLGELKKAREILAAEVELIGGTPQ